MRACVPAQTRRCRWEIVATVMHADCAWCVAFSHDGGRVVSSLSHGALHVWSADTGCGPAGRSHRHRARGRIRVVRHARAVCACDQTFRVWNMHMDACALLPPLAGHTDWVRAPQRAPPPQAQATACCSGRASQSTSLQSCLVRDERTCGTLPLTLCHSYAIFSL